MNIKANTKYILEHPYTKRAIEEYNNGDSSMIEQLIFEVQFHTFDKNKTEEELILETRDSIMKSIDYLIDIYKKNDMDLNKTHKELVNLYESKMQNNYNTFIKYLSEPKDGDKLLNFILYGTGNGN